MNKGTWRHCSPACTLDIQILSVLHKNSKRIKIKLCYISRKTGDVQYTGKGINGITDTARILIKDFKNWKQIN